MYDRFNRKINYLRISVTDRCNLRCGYCMPDEGIKLLNHNEILTFDEITNVARASVSAGIDKIRLTGGEPLVRKGIVTLVSMIAKIPGLNDLSLTTNAILLEHFAQELKDAGLQRINVSLDSVNAERYREITRGGDITAVFRGIDAAKKAKLEPVKINCVVWRTSGETDAQEVALFGKENAMEVRFIHQMDLPTGEFSQVEGGDGGNCKQCNRLRLTSNGLVKPCLFSDLGFSVRELGAENALKQALINKPECGTWNKSDRFYTIGG